MILLITFIFNIICEVIITKIISCYFWIQERLISKTSSSNKLFFGKLIFIIYKLYKILLNFFISIEPFYLVEYESNDSFHPKFFTRKSKKNIFCVLCCFSVSVILNIILNNIDKFKEIYLWIIDKQIIELTRSFIIDNKWFLLSSLGLLAFLYSYFKDKFTNKIIQEIHDQELHSIITTHKELFISFVTLHNILCENINHFFCAYKTNGVIYNIYDNISDDFKDYEYSTKQHSFQKRTSDNFGIYSLSKENGYKSISEIEEKMLSRIKEFDETNHFYNTSAINKYIHGLHGFDISSAIKNKNKSNLLCKEFFESIYENKSDEISDFLENENYDDESKITHLNELLDSKSHRSINAALNTIEYAIELETYINKFSKIFALKTRRKELSFEQIIDKYK